MRRFFALSLAVVLLPGLTCLARAEDDTKAIIEKAVKAHGGMEKLTKLKAKAVHSKAKGRVEQLGGIDITMEVFANHKGKFKQIIEGEAGGMKFTQTVVSDGKKMWIDVNGMGMEVEDEKALEEVKEQAYEETVTGLTFLKDKSIEMAPLGEVKVNDKPAVGVRVSSKGHRDVSLYFDKKSGLLVKTESRVRDFTSGQEAAQEKLLSDYKEKDGFLQPTKVTINRDGKKLMELEILEVKILDKLEDDVFAKP